MKQAPLVVCLHGFPDTPKSFNALTPLLRQAGYAVECPALPGYSPDTAIETARYDMDSVSDRLLTACEAFRRQQPHRPIHLVGHDWGAIAGFACVVKRPDLYSSYTSLSIPYPLNWISILRKAPTYLRAAWYIELFQLPYLPERIIQRQNLAFIDRLLASWSPGWEMSEEYLSPIKATLSSPRVLKAALSYYRSIPGISAGCRRARALLTQPLTIPTLLIQGARDACIPPALWNILDPNAFKGGFQHHIMAVGHFPQQENPVELSKYLLAHFARAS